MVALVSLHWQLQVSSLHSWSAGRQLEASNRQPHPQDTFVWINIQNIPLTESFVVDHLILHLDSGAFLVTGASAKGTSSKQDRHLDNMNINLNSHLNFHQCLSETCYKIP